MGKKRKLYEEHSINNYRELLQHTVDNYPNQIAYKFKQKPLTENPSYISITYKQFQEDVLALSTILLNLGLQNKKIAIIGENRYEWCTSYLAVTTADMIVVPLDKALPEKEIESLLLRSWADAIIFDEKYKETVLRIQKEGKSNLQYLICMDQQQEKEQVIDYCTLLEEGKNLRQEGNREYEKIKLEKDKMAIMLFTSGTTSQPKAVMLSQYNVCANIEAVASFVKMYPTDTLLSFLPLHHTFECTITFLYGIYYGVTVAFCDGLRYIQQNLKEYEVTVFVAVPLVLETMYKKICKAIEEKGKTKLIAGMSKISNALLKCRIDVRKLLFKPVLKEFGGKLRVVFYGAAPMDKKTIVGYNNLGIKLLQGYGLTETSPVISCETDEKQRPGSVGYPLYNVAVRIEPTEEIEEEGIGEILVKGPNVMLGYYENEKATKEVLKQGWFATGDYGYIDQDGFLYVTGRKKDVIVFKNGKNAYPQELEFLINQLPFVVESIVYAKERSGTDLMLGAKIVYNIENVAEYLGTDKTTYEKKIWEEMKKINKDLPIYKHIKEIIITEEPLIKTTTQKIKRYQEIKKIQSHV